MKVLIALNKTNMGGIQLSCTRSTNERGGIGTGYSLPPFNPNAIRDIEETLRCLGVDEDAIGKSVLALSEARPGELIRVADLDVPDEVLRESGFAA